MEDNKRHDRSEHLRNSDHDQLRNDANDHQGSHSGDHLRSDSDDHLRTGAGGLLHDAKEHLRDAKDHLRNEASDHPRDADDDMLRGNTMNETIREVSGNPDLDLNSIQKTGQSADSSSGSQLSGDNSMDSRQGVNWSPNDASGVRSGGTVDMDDQTAGGAGLNTGRTPGSGSNLAPKTGVTGSDYDGQNATS